MIDSLMDVFVRTWSDITSGRHAPLSFRFILQPAVALFLAIRAGRSDARAGRAPYFWTLAHVPKERGPLLREGWKHIGKVFIVAIVMDCIYQFIALRWIYPGEALIVAVVLAVLPYMVFRGIVNRILRRRQGK